eukprot:TRINITY_DN35948_c0_g1_i3.p1 TRINITY_DN35948_c0_g1~~TRINITY_DN35948_c0_g1_i3.p1  ORF type:complete len:862 (+),score=147.51 TRINITY_DN35948_c0_g1_i3:418-3003(+)
MFAGIFLKVMGWSAQWRTRPPNVVADQQGRTDELWATMEGTRGGAEQDPDGGRLALPSAADMASLPGYLRSTFRNLAMKTLCNHLYPRALLWVRRRRKKMLLVVARSQCPSPTVDVLRAQALFREWPRSLLEELLPRFEMEVFDSDEVIMHEREPGTGVYFLMSGRLEILKRVRGARGEPETKKRQKRLGIVHPVTCVGEFSILTEEPRMASIRAVDVCICLVLRKRVLEEYVVQLPPNSFSSIVDLAFAARNRTMHLQHPMSAQTLRAASPILRPCPDPVLDLMVAKLEPYCVPKDLILCRGEQLADRMYFLRNGRCGVMRTIVASQANKQQGAQRKPADTHVDTIAAPSTIGVVAVLQGINFGDTVKTLSTCDFWVLSKEAFDLAVRGDVACSAPMAAAARAVRQRQLEQQQNLFRQAIYDLPLLRNLCSRVQLRECVNAFAARLYKPLSMLVTRAEYADRIIILYKGRVRVGVDARWWPGEAQGFTCIVPHRWAHPAVSIDVAECLEFPLDAYEAFLTRHKLMRSMVLWATALMFPAATETQHPDVAIVHELVSHLRTPPLWPRSIRGAVDWSEFGFSRERPRHLAQRAARRRPPDDCGSQRPARAEQPSAGLAARSKRRPTLSESLGRTAPRSQGKSRGRKPSDSRDPPEEVAASDRLNAGLRGILSKAPRSVPTLGARDWAGRKLRPQPYDWQPESAQPAARGKGSKRDRPTSPRASPKAAPASPTGAQQPHTSVRLGTTQVWRLGGVVTQTTPSSVMIMRGQYPPREPRGTLYPPPQMDYGSAAASAYFGWIAHSGVNLPDPEHDARSGPARRRPWSASPSRPPPVTPTKADRGDCSALAVCHWYSPPLRTAATV